LTVAYLCWIMYTIDTYIAIFFVNWLHNESERMENVNQQLNLSFPQQKMYRCLQDCLGLQKSWLRTAPYVVLALKDVQEASAAFSDMKPSNTNNEYHFKVYKDAIDAIEKAVKRTEESCKDVQSAVQSIIGLWQTV
jgi:hypothetical protein